MSFKQMREAREEAYGRKVPGIRAFFSFWAPVVFLLSLLGVIGAVQSWNGDAVGLISSLALAVSAFSAAAFGRFWDKAAWISGLVFLGVLFVSRTWDFVSVISSMYGLTSALTGAVSEAGEGTGSVGGLITGAINAGINLGSGIVMAATIMAFLLYLVFIAYYVYIFIRHSELFLSDFSHEETK